MQEPVAASPEFGPKVVAKPALIARRSTAMSDTLTPMTGAPLLSVAAPRLQAATDRRPPARTWPQPEAVVSDQPTLLWAVDPAGNGAVGASGRARRVATGVIVTRSRWSPAPAAQLPDPGAWSVSLASALLEALQGHRPIGQLSRWVDEHVLGAISLQLRRRRSDRRESMSGTGWRPPALHSVRIQCPHPEAVEVTAHLIRERRSLAMAFRLEACGDRWLCTALELRPRQPEP